MNIDYQDIVYRASEKMIRQRDYWRTMAKKWRKRALTDPENRLVLLGKAEVLDHCAQDFDFILQKSLDRLTPEEREDIQSKADEIRETIAAKRAILNETT